MGVIVEMHWHEYEFATVHNMASTSTMIMRSPSNDARGHKPHGMTTFVNNNVRDICNQILGCKRKN